MAETTEARWYVVHTYSGYENKVANDLAILAQKDPRVQGLIENIKIPMETVTEVKEDATKREVERKIFPGYVFIKMVVTNDSWYVVRNIRGCTGFVSPASAERPVPLSAAEIASFRLEAGSKDEVTVNVEKHSVEVGYKEGDSVNIISGPLEGQSGVIKAIDLANNNVCVVLSLFGRETEVDFELDQISLAD